MNTSAFPELEFKCPITDFYINAFGIGAAITSSANVRELDVSLLCSSFLKKLTGQPSPELGVGS